MLEREDDPKLNTLYGGPLRLGQPGITPRER
jgi:hypothetical protein